MNHQREIAWKQIEAGTWNSNNLQTLRIYLKEHRGNTCEFCHLSLWMKKPIYLEIHHIDGNWNNNKLDNVKLVCPNCHSQTPSYKSKNNGSGRKFRYGYKK